MRKTIPAVLLLLVAGVFAWAPLQAYVISGDKWPGGRTSIYVGIPGLSASGQAWSVAMREAAEAWNNHTRFHFDINDGYRDPCADGGTGGDGLNGAAFGETVCGNDFGLGTLAVTVAYTQVNSLGTGDIVEADIIYNANKSFDIYPGPLDHNLQQFAGMDFSRVALHELGHVMGLGHESGRNRPAIMAPTVTNLDSLQEDDINGVNALYGGVNNCGKQRLHFGSMSEALTAGDCRVHELMSGGSDDSFVDVYELELEERSAITVDMESTTMDSVLILADEHMNILTIADNSGSDAAGCNARLDTTLDPGSYLVLSNTYVNPTDCGDNFGSYHLTMAYRNAAMPSLSERFSLGGGSADASFTGGVKVSGNATFSNRVRPSEPFDVTAVVQPDPRHQNQAGFLVVAAVLEDGSILYKSQQGDFVPLEPGASVIPPAYQRTLGSQETVPILSDIVAAELGILEIEIDFYVGYGVAAEPEELYYHGEGINLLVK